MPRLLVIAVFVGAVLGACDATFQPPDPPSPPDTLAVHAVLHSGRSTQRALVSRPGPVDVGDEGDTIRHVQDASVQIGNRTLTVLPRDSTANYIGADLLGRGANYEAHSFDVASGEAYSLRVARKGTEVTGTARVPGSFAVTVDSMTVQWSRSSGAVEYELAVQRYEGDGEPDEIWYRTRTQKRTVPIDPSGLIDPFRPGPYVIRVIAADSNLARYRNDLVRRSGLEGGLGVFGAVMVRQDTVSLPAN